MPGRAEAMRLSGSAVVAASTPIGPGASSFLWTWAIWESAFAIRRPARGLHVPPNAGWTGVRRPWMRQTLMMPPDFNSFAPVQRPEAKQLRPDSPEASNCRAEASLTSARDLHHRRRRVRSTTLARTRMAGNRPLCGTCHKLTGPPGVSLLP
jgi:hypothetical protein